MLFALSGKLCYFQMCWLMMNCSSQAYEQLKCFYYQIFDTEKSRILCKSHQNETFCSAFEQDCLYLFSSLR